MSLLHREVRTLARDVATDRFRDHRRFLVACDDTHAPQQYFELLKMPRVEIIIVPTEDGTSTPERVLDRLVGSAKKLEIDEELGDECWMILDTDHLIEGTHLKGFTAAIREANRKRIRVAISRPCFEVWLLLHEVDENVVRPLETCKQVITALKTLVGKYDKSKLRAEHYKRGSALEAILRAEKLDATVSGGDIPAGTTTRMYLLLKAIAEKALPSQLPPELQLV